MTLVIGASVALTWFVEEDGSAHAAALLTLRSSRMAFILDAGGTKRIFIYGPTRIVTRWPKVGTVRAPRPRKPAVR